MQPKTWQRLVYVGLIAIGILLTALPAAALHWSGSGSFGPYNVYQGVVTQFTFTLSNQASGSLDVYWVWVHYCWNPTNSGYYFKANDGTTVSIAGGSSHDFSAYIQVDQTTSGNCPVQIQASGKAVGDFSQETATYNAIINVLSVPPLQVTAVANPSNGVAPLSVSFTSSVSGGLSPYTYAWAFGDGGTSSLANPTYTYQTAGTYSVTLVVQDSQGTQKSATASVNVIAPLTATMAADVTTGTIPLAVSFSVTVSGGTAPYTYAWDFGDGSSSTQQNPSHTYQIAGTYTVSITVTDGGGRSITRTTTVTANSNPITGTGTGIPPWVYYVIVAIIVLAVVAFVVVRMRRGRQQPPPRAPPPPP